jgi:hypothetical protein
MRNRLPLQVWSNHGLSRLRSLEKLIKDRKLEVRWRSREEEEEEEEEDYYPSLIMQEKKE